VHVWFADTEARVDDTVLSPDERERALRFRFDRDRGRFVAARSTLRLILAQYLDAEAGAIEFGYGAQGKPHLAGEAAASGLHFNLAHAQGVAVYALARGRAVGVDIESVRPLSDADEIAERFFSPQEARQLRALPAPDKERAFFNCWTRKEAFIKALGQGLSYPLDRFEVSIGPKGRLVSTDTSTPQGGDWSLREIEAPSGYVAAVAAAGVEWSMVGPRGWPIAPENGAGPSRANAR